MGLFDFLKKKGSWVADPNLKTIAETVVADDDYKTLVAALKEAGLVDLLGKKGPFTVFVPNNSAFIDLPDGTVEALLKDKAKLKAVLTHHVVEGAFSYDQLMAKPTVAAADQKELAVDAKGLLKIAGATIIRGNIKCRNGYIHVVNKVLVP
ncbi:MAG TPA: fasciclin domain-containing protein [Methanomassiliicoccales archaeon]|nr:fasciclin domain-containing protein [Methanomassiliicoccales archaeon]